MKYKAVIFDLFGTLVDNYSWPEYRSILVQMADLLGVPVNTFREMWTGAYVARATGDLPSTEACILYVCENLGVKPDRESVEAAVKARVEYTRRELAPRPDAVLTLTRLKEAGLKLGLISDCSSEVPLLWDETPFAKLIEVPIFSSTARLKKPDPRIYLLACERLGVSPEDCLYVGDGDSRELTGADRVGMSPVLIKAPQHNAPQIDPDTWEGPPVSSLSEILPIVLDS